MNMEKATRHLFSVWANGARLRLLGLVAVSLAALLLVPGSSAQTVSFGPATNFAAGSNVTLFVAIGDFNGDGKPDLAVANWVSNNVSILLNTTVLSASQAIQNLMQIMQSFNLQQGATNALDSKLQNLQDSVNASNAGRRQDAVNKLQAFINSVEAQRGMKLTAAQADTLVAMTRWILGVL